MRMQEAVELTLDLAGGTVVGVQDGTLPLDVEVAVEECC